MLDIVKAHFFEARCSAGSSGAQAEVPGAHERAGGEQDAALDGVIEFADVSGPGMLVKDLRCDGIKSGDGFAIALGIAAEKVMREQVDIFVAFAQWREMNFDGVETEKKILAEASGSGFGGDINICGGGHPGGKAAGGWGGRPPQCPPFQG